MPEDAARTGDTPDGAYVYGVIRSEAPQTFAVESMGGRGDPVVTTHHGALAAVVSASPVVDYPSNRRNMMTHTRVLEAVMARFTLLPARFGIVAPSIAETARRFLEPRHDALVRQIAMLDGHIEVGVKAIWRDDVVFQEILDETPEIRRLRARLVNRPPQETYYERIQVGKLVEAAMERKRAAELNRILARLTPLAADTRLGEIITERMALNGAFLVARDRETAFDRAVEALEAEMGARMILKYVGPVPPYNFVDLGADEMASAP